MYVLCSSKNIKSFTTGQISSILSLSYLFTVICFVTINVYHYQNVIINCHTCTILKKLLSWIAAKPLGVRLTTNKRIVNLSSLQILSALRDIIKITYPSYEESKPLIGQNQAWNSLQTVGQYSTNFVQTTAVVLL